MIKVILCDDHAVVRRGIRDTIAEAVDIQVVGEAGSYPELREQMRKTLCDVLVLDLNMPGRGGLEVLAALRAGITTVFIPKENEKDLVEIPESVKKALRIIAVNHVDEVIAKALVRTPEPIVWVEPEEAAVAAAEAAVGLALALVYLLLAAQFDSFVSPISIMLSVISGFTSPGKGLRPSRCSMSLAAAERSKSVGFTSCSSSSTPMVRAVPLLKGSRAMISAPPGDGLHRPSPGPDGSAGGQTLPEAG